VHAQELIEQRDKAFNMITIYGPNNTATNIYFDISTYYRRIGNEQFPKPM
jgi:predicted RNA-binding protein associated with RNAse of E/G family